MGFSPWGQKESDKILSMLIEKDLKVLESLYTGILPLLGGAGTWK